MKPQDISRTIANKVRIRVLIIALASFLMLVMATTSHAQKLSATAFVESNIMGVQRGLAVSTSLFQKLKVAYFYQASQEFSFESNSKNYPFHGLHINLPLTECGKVTILAGVKTGLVNGKYLAATPQIDSEIKIINHLKIGITTGYRAGHAAVGTYLTLHL